jgi:hypothetical protein
MTDKEFENWIKESLFEQKGFVRWMDDATL